MQQAVRKALPRAKCLSASEALACGVKDHLRLEIGERQMLQATFGEDAAEEAALLSWLGLWRGVTKLLLLRLAPGVAGADGGCEALFDTWTERALRAVMRWFSASAFAASAFCKSLVIRTCRSY